MGAIVCKPKMTSKLLDTHTDMICSSAPRSEQSLNVSVTTAGESNSEPRQTKKLQNEPKSEQLENLVRLGASVNNYVSRGSNHVQSKYTTEASVNNDNKETQYHRCNLLVTAVQLGHSGCVSVLLREGAHLKQEGHHALMWAAASITDFIPLPQIMFTP